MKLTSQQRIEPGFSRGSPGRVAFFGVLVRRFGGLNAVLVAWV
jgi:hypothetical protein